LTGCLSDLLPDRVRVLGDAASEVSADNKIGDFATKMSKKVDIKRTFNTKISGLVTKIHILNNEMRRIK
jgi:hypothetical protein